MTRPEGPIPIRASRTLKKVVNFTELNGLDGITFKTIFVSEVSQNNGPGNVNRICNHGNSATNGSMYIACCK